MTLASLITVLRFPLLVVVVLILFLGGTTGQLLAALLILVLILMDTLDGMVARRRGEQTLIGSVLDIAADRAVEIVLWVVYAHLRLIPVVIPVTVIIRGALTDSIRSLGLREGQSAHSMMRSRLGHWLVASSAMRTSYGVAKATAFIALALTLAARSGGYSWGHGIWIAAMVFSWASLALCLLRGLPVIAEAVMTFGSSAPD